MKALVTVVWSHTVEIEVDSKKLKNLEYVDSLKNEAIGLASSNISWKGGIITDATKPNGSSILELID